MSTEVKAKARVLRRATFVVDGEGKTKVFRAVNKRAHKLARKLGKRTKLTPEDMKAAKALKRYKLAAYTAEGTLKAIR